MKLYRAVVEDNKDPEKLGMVKVRIYGLHTKNNENSGEFSAIATDDLPWAQVMGGTSFGLVGGVGISSVLRQGTWVWVILEADNPNKPIVIGTLIGKNSTDSVGKYSGGEGFFDPEEEYPFAARSAESDINRLARNEQLGEGYYDVAKGYGQMETIHKIINDNVDVVSQTDGFTGANVSQTEPNSLNDASAYPDVNILETHSGHVIELDDTDGNERVRVYHKSGSYIEIRPDGSFVQKSVGTDASHYIHMSDVHSHIAAGVKEYIEANKEEIIGGNLLSNVKGNLKLHVAGNLDWQVDGNITITSGGTQTTTNGGNYTHTAPRIDLNP